jgi:hypothetical protein
MNTHLEEVVKIYGSTEYIAPKNVKVGNLKLEVNSMWDFKSRTVCFGKAYKGQPNEQTISYNLKKCIEVKDPTYTRWENAEITDEIKEELMKKGYTLSQELLQAKELLK